MYKQLKNQIDDKTIIELNIRELEDRIRHIIQKQLGLKGTSFADIKMETIGNDNDKFTNAFAKVEKLDKDRITLVEEKKIIDDFLNIVCKKIGETSNKEQKVFRCRYMLGLTRKETAERLGYTEDRIKQITREIFKKM